MPVKKLADPADALLPALAAIFLLLLLPPPGQRLPHRPAMPLPVRSLLMLKPPLRGPPRQSRC